MISVRIYKGIPQGKLVVYFETLSRVVRKRSSSVILSEIVDFGHKNKKEEIKEMAEKKEEVLAKIINLCDTDPDAGLEFIELTIKENPESESDPFGKFAKAMAYGSKGIFQLARSKPEIDFTVLDGEEMRDVGISDTHLDYLEKGLQEIKEMEEIYPGALKLFGTNGWGEDRVDAMAGTLGRCRPGRVQQILGKTKLFYFGADRIKVVQRMGPGDLKPFMRVFFSSDFIAKSALVNLKSTDDKGRQFILVQLFGKTFDEFGEDETFGDARPSTYIKLFDDGTFFASQKKGEEKPEEKQEPQKKEEPKKKGFFKKLFG